MPPVIYVPKGKAREYAPLAANLYDGCSHGCRYCYAPAVLRRSREDFARDPRPRPGVLEQLRKDAARLAALTEVLGRGHPRGPVLLCFTCDPYQPAEADHCPTRQAVRILADAGLYVRILTKNPRLAITRDLGLLCSAGVDFGVSLSFVQIWAQEEWEPHAGSIGERMRALEHAHAYGLRTWVSVEPVIYADQALEVLDLHDVVDVFKIGKLNHDRERERAIDWRAFLAAALEKLEARACGYYIKEDLWTYADDGIRASFAQERP